MDKYAKLMIHDRLDAIRGMVKQGIEPSEICRALGASVRDFNKWRKDYPEFNEAVTFSDELMDGELLETAYRQSIGYYVEEDSAFKIKSCKEIDGKAHSVEEVKVVRIRKYIPPSSRMSLFMLQNRVMPNEVKTPKEIVVRLEDGTEEFAD